MNKLEEDFFAHILRAISSHKKLLTPNMSKIEAFLTIPKSLNHDNFVIYKTHLQNCLLLHILWLIYPKNDPRYLESDRHMEIKNIIFD